MKEKFTFLTALSWLVQVGVSVAFPLVLFILLAVFLRNRFGIGNWIIAAGVGRGRPVRIASLAAPAREKRKGAA